nr:Gfo/Idh/MocA family oxidoreductase [Marinicella sp. W31]MDC2877613.1 Gfo/Idh/MocA family oxidoreductase [Marinicella sp. W31]
MTKELGVGILGCGNISATYFSLSPMFKGIKVLACADINPAAAKARAEEYGVIAQSVDELFANDEIDVVVNLTIPAAHFEMSRRALEAGKHVYSEKPLVLSVDEGKDLGRLAAEKGSPSVVRRIRSWAAPTSAPANTSMRAGLAV